MTLWHKFKNDQHHTQTINALECDVRFLPKLFLCGFIKNNNSSYFYAMFLYNTHMIGPHSYSGNI